MQTASNPKLTRERIHEALWAAVAKEAEQSAHLEPALVALEIQRESGRVADMAKTAEDLRKKMVAWTEPRSGDWTLTLDRYRVFGKKMTPNAALLRRRIGYIPTNPRFPRGMTPITYLDYVARLFGLAASARKPSAVNVGAAAAPVRARRAPGRAWPGASRTERRAG